MRTVEFIYNAERSAMKETSSEQFTRARFQAALKTQFRVRFDAEAAILLSLVEVTEGGAGTGDSRGENFSLIFNGPGDRFLPQRTYSFDHADLGKFDLFIVPVGRERDGFLYQAVFNRRA